MTAPLFTPIDWVSIRNTLLEWFATVSGCETIWSDEGGPQPAYPYGSLNILPGTTAFGALDEARPQADGSMVLVGQRDFILSCQIHVGGDQAINALADARMRADAIIASLAIPQFLDALEAVNLGLRERGQPQTINLLVGTEWIKRAQVDIRFGTTSVVDTSAWPDLGKVGWFNKVRMSSDLSPLRGGGGLNWTDEVLDPNA